jgi:hypothetical protein
MYRLCFAIGEQMSLIANTTVMEEICSKNTTSWKGEVQIAKLFSCWFSAVAGDGTRCLVLWQLLPKNWWWMWSNRHDIVVQELGVAVLLWLISASVGKVERTWFQWRFRCLFCDGSVVMAMALYYHKITHLLTLSDTLVFFIPQKYHDFKRGTGIWGVASQANW